MHGIIQSLLFLNALLTHANRLRNLLGGQWPAFRDRLKNLLTCLLKANDDTEVQLWVDEVIDAGLDSPAKVLVRDLLRQAQACAGQVDSGATSVRMTDPTSGQTREVAVRSIMIAKAAAQPLSRADLAKAAQSLAQTLETPPFQEMLPPVLETERHISSWISERPEGLREPLRVDEIYTLNFKVGQPVQASIISGPDTVIPAEDVPPEGLATEWVVTTTTVELAVMTPDTLLTSIPVDNATAWIGRFPMVIPIEGDSPVMQLRIIPRTSQNPSLDVVIYAQRELYRRFTVRLIVVESTLHAEPVEANLTAICDDVLYAPAAHLDLMPAHEWMTPPGELSIAVTGQQGMVYVRGDAGPRFIDQGAKWFGVPANVAGPIDNTRASAERFRARWEDYLNDIDPEDLAQRLEQWSPDYDWTQLGNHADQQHQTSWEAVQVSPELRDLAFDGHTLYEAFFPPKEELRSWIDALAPGHRLAISWRETSSGWIPHVPWGLMYLPDPPAPGEPVDPMGFLGLRFRIDHTAHEVQAPSKALGGLDDTHRMHFLYWGDQPQDLTAVEARWQRQQLATWPNQIFFPTTPEGANCKGEVIKRLNEPEPNPVAVLYLFCQCTVGDGNDPVLRFGSTAQAADILRRSELGTKLLTDRPLVFANACTTAATDPYIANELERGFFNRGCRAYLGTESKVPIQFASRFAVIFFRFFYRQLESSPIAAGEAMTQTQLFLWTRYRNIGGILYTYINQYELFMATDSEVRSLRV